MSEIRELQDLIKRWADDVFPDRTIQSAALKLYEEIGEMLRDPTNADEHADIYIMMFDLSHKFNVDIAAAVRRKMAINVKRSWKTTPTGTLQHTDGDAVHNQEMYDLGRQHYASGRWPEWSDEFYLKGYFDGGSENEGSGAD